MFIFQNQCKYFEFKCCERIADYFLLRTVTTKRLFIAFDSYYVEPVLRVGDR